MWLLDTRSQQLKYFRGNQIPSQYAILSHRWQDEEVTFEDIYDGRTSYTSKHGWSKVTKCCQLARSNGFDYVWIDSCCIDKRSSAELSEAINSMYEWYGKAVVCYTYLFDVHDAEDVEQFNRSSWFKRSWTLQELLAPATMYFFTAAWQEIGSKERMSDWICGVTSIPKSALKHFDSSEYSIAQRMGWAAGREATRVEDVAYSLLGIFDINMPLLYGEGSRAYQRLQEAIMGVSNDLSLFVWEGKSCTRFGVLADTPSGFGETWPSARGDLDPIELSKGYTFNNAGLLIELDIQPLFLGSNLAGIYAAYLHDPGSGSARTREIMIYLLKDAQRNRYRRVSIGGRSWNSNHWRKHPDGEAPPIRMCQIMIQKDAMIPALEPAATGFIICGCPRGVYVHMKSGQAAGNFPTHQDPHVSTGWTLLEEGKGRDISVTVPARASYGIFGYLAWTRTTDKNFVILGFGYDFDFRPLCLAFVFPGDRCANPLMGLSPGVLMNQYLQILPNSSSLSCAKGPNSIMYAIRGEQKINSKRDLPDLNLSVRFLPTKSSLCRMFIDFGMIDVPAAALPVRSSDSMTRLRHLFGASERPGVGTMMIESSMARTIYNNTRLPGYDSDLDTRQSPRFRVHSWIGSRTSGEHAPDVTDVQRYELFDRTWT